ncbi:MAG: lipid carrier--UDP-N-acetylgalactosaminyltransferase [Candidatus Marinimicrobia bacterium]|nr:lipid carrier--UDP-N-acetylgalactosaminyltransferase [Candidatus Neomarinimicrobiota bacterium]|tara:strand:- start:363 stop:914 length:552 start_codon:yes stop_codon:yes gene_type:complete
MISKLIALLLFVLLSPIFLLISLIIYIDDGFPILFKQKRIGENNSKFFIYKFRTMFNDLADIPTHLLKDPHNHYINTGLFLRKLSLDEIPQLINIIKGEMVFVGPRPALYNQSDLIKLRTIASVHNLIPGITGWAQVNGRDNLSISQKVKYDIFYLKNKSLFLDLKILLLTLLKVFGKNDVLH